MASGSLRWFCLICLVSVCLSADASLSSNLRGSECLNGNTDPKAPRISPWTPPDSDVLVRIVSDSYCTECDEKRLYLSGLGDDVVLSPNPDDDYGFWVFHHAGEWECGWGPDYPCYKISNYFRDGTQLGKWLNIPGKGKKANLLKTKEVGDGLDIVWSPVLATDPNTGVHHVAFRLSQNARSYDVSKDLLSAWAAKGGGSWTDLNCWTWDLRQQWRVELAQPKIPTSIPVRIKTRNDDSRIDTTRPYLKGKGPGNEHNISTGESCGNVTLTDDSWDPTAWWIFHEMLVDCGWGPPIAYCYNIQNYAWIQFWNKDFVVEVPPGGQFTRARMHLFSYEAKNNLWSPTTVNGPGYNDSVAFRLSKKATSYQPNGYLLTGWANKGGDAYANMDEWQNYHAAQWTLEPVNQEDLDPYDGWFKKNAFVPPRDQVVRLKTTNQKFVLRGNPGQNSNLASMSTDERNPMSMWRFREAEDCATAAPCYWIENYGTGTIKQPPQAYKLSFDTSTLPPGTVRTAIMMLTPDSNGKWIPFATCSGTGCSQQGQGGWGAKISLAPRSEGYTDKYQSLVPVTGDTSVSLKKNKDKIDNPNGYDWIVEVVPRKDYDPYGWEYDQVNEGQHPWVPPLDTPVYISNNGKLLHKAGFCGQAEDGCKYSTRSRWDWWMFQNWTKCLDIVSNVKDLGTTAPAYCIVNYFQHKTALGLGSGSGGHVSGLPMPPNFTDNSVDFAWVAIPAGQKCSPGETCQVKLGLVPSSNHYSSGKAWVSVADRHVELASFSGALQTWKVTPVRDILPKVDCSNTWQTSCGAPDATTNCNGNWPESCCPGRVTCPSYSTYQSPSCDYPKKYVCKV